MRTGENISRRKDKRWEARVLVGHKEDGRPRYKYFYGRSYQESKEKRNRYLKEHGNTDDTPPCRLTTKILFEQWLAQKRGTVKASSFYQYQRLVQTHILPELGALRVDSLTPNILTQFINHKLDNGRRNGKGGLSPKTVQDIVVILKSALRLAEQVYHLPGQAAAIKAPRAAQPEIQVLDEAEIQRLEEHLREQEDNSNAGFRLCLYTGLRLGEVCALRWSDIDWNTGVLRVRHTVARLPEQGGGPRKTRLTLTSPKTKRAVREIPLPAQLLQHLRTVACGQSAEAFILTGLPERMMDPRTYQNQFKRLLERLNIRHISFHGIRHTFATVCVRQGMDVKSLSEILGHATVKMTLDRYVHPSLEVKRQQMEQLCFVA